MSHPRLLLTDVVKRFPAVLANDHVSLQLEPGQIHAVLGENGAGKSTLMKIIYGAQAPDSGSIAVDGQAVTIASPQQARGMGISMVYQHFSLFETLTAAQNIWLGLDKKLSLAQVKSQVQEKAAQYGLAIEPDRPVHSLSVGERQRVEIVRALLSNPRILILDEPTSVLTPQAVGKLFETLRQLSEQGCSILYISHKLHEIRELCSACTVLRGGRVTGSVDPRQESNASLSRLMIGADPPTLTIRSGEPGPQVMQVQSLSLPRGDQYGTDLAAIELSLRSGEIVGIAGVSGNGQQELLRALSGEDQRSAAGSITIADTDVSGLNSARRRELGLHVVPEERLGRGAVPLLPLADNLLLTRRETVSARGWIDRRALRTQAERIIDRFKVKAGGAQAAAQSLSGGNLQKFIVGREVSANPRVLILSQPTWGVDVGAAAQIRSELIDLRGVGCALLVISEELDELFQLCDRIHVLSRGRLSPAVSRADATTELIGSWMSGLWPQASHAAA